MNTIFSGVIQSADDQKDKKFDLTKGIELTWNHKGHCLIVAYEGEQVAEIQNIRAKKVYPLIVFNQRGVFPVELKYIEGPQGKRNFHYMFNCNL